MAKSSLMQKKRDGEKAQMGEKGFAELEIEENKKKFAELKTEENKKRERFEKLENAIKGIDELGKTLAQKEISAPGGQEKQSNAGYVYKKAVEEMGALEKKLKKEMV